MQDRCPGSTFPGHSGLSNRIRLIAERVPDAQKWSLFYIQCNIQESVEHAFSLAAYPTLPLQGGNPSKDIGFHCTDQNFNHAEDRGVSK
jgi:hypothetical protein